jgi:bifunctional ADP-heptose synthase (sugar kinase/adenylyltransferase)
MIVTIIGEHCEDIFIYGDTPRLSPEAPIPVFIPKVVKTNNGMSGNVADNIKSIEPNYKIIQFHQTKKITKTRYVDDKSNHMFLRIDDGESNIDKFNLNISTTNTIVNSDIVIVSDYNKGFLNLELIEEIGKLSKLSILDSKRELTKEVVNSFTFVKLNQVESEKNNKLIDCKNIIVTLGSKGCRYGDKIFESPSPKETIDVSGAGDTFTSSFILKYFETNDSNKSIIYANEMASIVVSKRGVVTPY